MPRQKNSTNSRNGCITCKFRHVKCDEVKPACGQCTSTARKCDGYNNESQRQLRQKLTDSSHTRRRISPDSRLVLVPGTREEREYIHLFCTQTSKSLSGFFQSDLWLYYLPQLSQSEPAVRHAVAAVSATHKRLLEAVGVVADDDHQAEPFVLEQYNKAIRSLVPHPAGSVQAARHPSRKLILVTCSLFICLELMKSNNTQAMDHAEAGLRILCRDERVADDGDSELPSNIESELSDFFSRMNLERSFFGRPMIPYKLTLEKPTEEKFQFANMSQARGALTKLLTLVFVLVRRTVMFNVNLSEVERQECLRAQDTLIQECKKWEAAFQQLRKRLEKSKKRADSDQRAPLVLQVQYLTAWIFINTCLAPDQMVYDKYNPEYHDLVTAAEQISQLSPPITERTESFSLETYTVASVYWTARKCRHPMIRRRAIAVLETYPRQEGLWATREKYAVAKFNMELEEESLVHLPVEERVPDERHRFFETQIYEEGAHNPCEVVFLTAPENPGDEWGRRFEKVWW
ncbi:hypothetical protein FQN54_007189 [Arachnomyces sp. PD_36]|nr:hypothetical protein FQN54_007189 [Arachnomyces sp. PD_36]